jgi:hypothetical protein
MSKLLQLQPLGQGQIEYLLHLINMEEARLTAQLHTCADDQVDPLLHEWGIQLQLKEAIKETLEGGSHE